MALGLSRRYVLAALLLLNVNCSNAFVLQPRSVNLRNSITTAPTTTTTTTTLHGKLWERLQIDEDPEPMWYLLNCIAGLEIDLLRLCRAKCGDHEDVVKFVVPIEKSTRSHGPNRIVTDTKVRYQGYVFGKLRLCERVYEDVQELDLCRSWMGTVNKKGYQKLPPAPVALNELEIEKFGLEDLVEGMEDDTVPEDDIMDENGIILDTEENEAKAIKLAKKRIPKIDEDQLKEYMDLRVDDMIKVTASNKFKGEDGIIKRLKNGELLIRFFTYGSTYEEWLKPDEVRKLSEEEVVRGLQGPSTPMTQQDFEEDDGPPRGRDSNRSGPGGGLRNALMTNVSGNRGPRNTRQERTQRGDRFKNTVGGDRDDRKSEQDNWSWYQDQQKNGDQQRPGRNDRNSAEADVDGQWGRFSQRQNRRERGPQQEGDNRRNDRGPPPPRNKRENQRVENAIDGGDDWSAFVSPASAPAKQSSKNDDDFFSSLMSELNGEQDNQPSKPAPKKAENNDDDFFSSLMSELNDDGDNNNNNKSQQQPQQRQPQKKETAPAPDDNDFFAALEAELGSDPAPPKGGTGTDNFFAKLEAEMEEPPLKPSAEKAASPDSGSDDFFADLEKELSNPGFVGAVDEAPAPAASNDNNADFFADLEKELQAPTSVAKETEEKVEQKPSAPMRKPKPVEAAAPSSNSDGASLGKKTVPVLKEMLRERGLKVSGKKAELIERLSQ